MLASVRGVQVAQSADNEADEGSEQAEGPENTADDAQEAQEMAQYQSLVKVTAQQAQLTAEALHGGSATHTELSVEDGSLVYDIEFANANIMVDAGTGQILKTEAQGQEQNDVTETPIQGSIQVPDNDGGDQGGAQQ
ncbi:MAG: peptidase [Phormidesmis priestleyi]|uniref:Peptidase n=1 Tax=Phormidesmis priestleyi TaxID=268141 RepID=A0A2W4XH46_9CYAN|nr:MAG: peptidase [Phormidesmis priestleyi]